MLLNSFYREFQFDISCYTSIQAILGYFDLAKEREKYTELKRKESYKEIEKKMKAEGR